MCVRKQVILRKMKKYLLFTLYEYLNSCTKCVKTKDVSKSRVKTKVAERNGTLKGFS